MTGPVVPAGRAGGEVRVFRPGRPGVCAGRVVWAGTVGGRDDAALVVLEDPSWEPPQGGVVRWGSTVTYRPGIRCESWGLPALAQREDRPAELWQPSGTLNPGDRYVGDRYVMNVDGHPPSDRDGSPWGGMSGAALFCGDLLAGVIASDPAGLGHSRLEAVPAYVLLADPGFRAVLAEHTGQTSAVLEPIEYQQLTEPADPITATQGASPAALLRARRQVVPFHGRDPILRDLHAWAGRPGFGAHLLHAAGGQGKTRLALHLAGQLAAAGWAVVWLDARAGADQLAGIKDAATPLLVVIDYAESRTRQVSALLEECARHEGGSPLKVVLLARTAGSWWQTLREESPAAEALLEGAAVLDLPALEPGPGAQADAYQQAATAFAAALAVLPGWQQRPWRQMAAALPGPPARRAGLDNALTLHMTALADLLDRAVGPPADDRPGDSDDGGDGDGQGGARKVEDRLLVHERRYWRATATGNDLYPAVSMATLADALAAAVGLGAADRRQADALLARVPGLSDQPRDRRDRVRAWITGLYPPAVQQAPWGGLQPDRLAERFLGRHLTDHPDLADHLIIDATSAQVTQLLTVYARAAAHPVFEHRLDEALTGLCARHPQVTTEPAIQVVTQIEAPGPLLAALQRMIDDPATTPADLVRWSGELPRTSYALAGWAADLSTRLVDHQRRQTDPSSLPDLATSLNNQSVQLGDLGRGEEALEAITEAVTIRRTLAQIRPAVHQQELEHSLAVMEWLNISADDAAEPS
ncbi:hypothetical protein ACOZ38_21040 [Sphaerisporangium viridialbum]|uniref:P-loop NTPase n=1 Tax=Sphaerisporangium viridialbum TaxID=46189 RepID=UPI003C709CD5